MDTIPGASSWHPHEALVRCEVRSLGHCAPHELSDNSDAVARPINAHPTGPDFRAADGPLDTVLTVYTSGILAQSHAFSADHWWPVQDLIDCGAFRAVHGPRDFIPISAASSQHLIPVTPPLFAMTFWHHDEKAPRTWVFTACSEDGALALVNGIKMAHGHPDGWSLTKEKPLVTANSAPGRYGEKRDGKQTSSLDDYFPGGHQEWGGATVRKGLFDNKRKLNDYFKRPAVTTGQFIPQDNRHRVEHSHHSYHHHERLSNNNFNQTDKEIEQFRRSIPVAGEGLEQQFKLLKVIKVKKTKAQKQYESDSDQSDEVYEEKKKSKKQRGSESDSSDGERDDKKRDKSRRNGDDRKNSKQNRDRYRGRDNADSDEEYEKTKKKSQKETKQRREQETFNGDANALFGANGPRIIIVNPGNEYRDQPSREKNRRK